MLPIYSNHVPYYNSPEYRRMINAGVRVTFERLDARQEQVKAERMDNYDNVSDFVGRSLDQTGKTQIVEKTGYDLSEAIATLIRTFQSEEPIKAAIALLKESGYSFPVPVFARPKIKMIKQVRDDAGIGLKDAKDLVELIERIIDNNVNLSK